MVRIEAAGPEDRLAVRDLLGQLGYAFTAEEVQVRLSLLAASGVDPVLLAIQDGEVVGLIALHVATMLQLKQPVARITVLVMRDGVRGVGVGRMLVDAGCMLAARSGCGLLEPTTAVAHTEAHAFYRKLGFTNSSRRFSRPVKEAAAS